MTLLPSKLYVGGYCFEQGDLAELVDAYLSGGAEEYSQTLSSMCRERFDAEVRKTGNVKMRGGAVALMENRHIIMMIVLREVQRLRNGS